MPISRASSEIGFPGRYGAIECIYSGERSHRFIERVPLRDENQTLKNNKKKTTQHSYVFIWHIKYSYAEG